MGVTEPLSDHSFLEGCQAIRKLNHQSKPAQERSAREIESVLSRRRSKVWPRSVPLTCDWQPRVQLDLHHNTHLSLCIK